MKIAITGHRPNKLGNDYDLTNPLIIAIRARIVEIIINNSMPKDVTLITGMALGIDTLFAKIAISLNIPFIAAIPCYKQESKWPFKSQQIYQYLIEHKLCTIYMVSETGYTPNCMQKRNKWMVDNCDLLIAVWDGSSGGTANCIKYAEKIKKQIIRINPKEI